MPGSVPPLMHAQLVISFPVWHHSFVEFDHDIFSTDILSLPLVIEGQLLGKESLCLPMKSVVTCRLTDGPDMTIAVYHGC